MKRKTREEKAITLIALIITIVVLLILAVVAINAVTGDGIIQHATNAKTEYEKAQEKEDGMIEYYEKYLESQGSADIWNGKTSAKPEIKDGNWYIYTCSEFKFFADFVNKEPGIDTTGIEEITENTTVYLMSNLDLGARQENGVLNSGTEWMPIGNSSTNTFAGTFDGNNHYIKGIYVNRADSGFGGIFGNSTNTIKNLTVKDSYVEAAGTAIGGIVGRGTIIENCHNINTAVTVKINGPEGIGGVTGRAKYVKNCTNTGIINANESYRVGGIVGFLVSDGGEIYNCKNYANITVNNGGEIGGILGVGYKKVKIDGCANIGNIVGNIGVGGIIGSSTAYQETNPDINITNCYNKGNITGTENNQSAGVGGIIGSSYYANTAIKLKACYNTGLVDGKSNVGKIIGYKDTSEDVTENCYYLGETTNSSTGEMAELDMKKKEFADTLNETTKTGAWVGSDTDYPKLSWEK